MKCNNGEECGPRGPNDTNGDTAANAGAGSLARQSDAVTAEAEGGVNCTTTSTDDNNANYRATQHEAVDGAARGDERQLQSGRRWQD